MVEYDLAPAVMNTSGLGKVKAGKKREDINYNAKIAQLVEHDLAKVGVAGSSPVFRSLKEVVIRVVTSFAFGGGRKNCGNLLAVRKIKLTFVAF